MQNSPSTIPIVRFALPSLHRHQYSPACAIVRYCGPFVCALVPIENHISIYERSPFSHCSGRGDRYRCGGARARKTRRKEIEKPKKNEKRKQNELWMDGKYIVLIFDGMNVRDECRERGRERSGLWNVQSDCDCVQVGDGKKYRKYSCANSKGTLCPASTAELLAGCLGPATTPTTTISFHSWGIIYFLLVCYRLLVIGTLRHSNDQGSLERANNKDSTLFFLKSSDFAFWSNLQAAQTRFVVSGMGRGCVRVQQ